MATYPDGTLLKTSGPEVDRMEGGQRRWIPDPPTFTCMGLSGSAIQTISDSEWNQIPKGAAYPSRADGTLLQGSGPAVYVMTACQRHLIPDPATFNAHGYNWSAIHHVSDTDLTAIPEGAPLPHPDGTLLKASGPEVDRMEGGQRRWIPDPPTFTCMGLSGSAIQTISDSEWNQIPKGAAYPSRADGTLLQGSGPAVYVMAACQRHWIPDPDTFNAHGYNWNAIHHVSDADLAAIPEGAPLPSVGPRLSDWMTVNASVIKNLPLWQIALPGSHDSGTYGYFGVPTPWTKAQGLSIGNQLVYGIRYFDLRFLSQGGGRYVVEHGGYTCDVTLEAVLHDIKTFLEYPGSAGEILIVELRWGQTSLDEEKLLVSKICDECGRERIITKQTIEAINGKTGSTKKFPAHCTPGELWDAGKKQVIILWAGQAGIIQWKQDHDDDPQSDARYIWAGDYFQVSRAENYPTAWTPAELIGGRTRDLRWWAESCKTIQDESQTRYWWRLGVHLTPGTENAGMPLALLAEASLPTVLEHLRGDWKGAPWNIVSTDLFETTQYVDFVQAVIQLNGQYQY